MSTADPTAPSQGSSAAASGRRRRLRPALAVLLGILACLALVASTTAVWVHQVAFNTDRWVSLSSQVIEDPAVVASLSDGVSRQVVAALDVQARLQAALPDQAKLLAGPVTAAVQERLRDGLSRLLASPGFQQAWAAANRFTHGAIVKVLRGDLTGVEIDNGYVTLNVFPLVRGALQQLQADGIIPASVTLPDLSGSAAPEVARAALQNALGVTLPADFGTIQVARADRLEAAQTAVRAFDILVVVAIVVTILLYVAAALAARNRRRAVVLLGFGSVVALLLVRAIVRGVENAIVGSITGDDASTTVRGVFDAVLNDLFGVMVLVTIAGAIVAVAAWLVGRREQLGELAGQAGSAARRAAAAGAESGQAAASGAAARVGAAGAAAGSGVAGAGLSLRDRARPYVSQLRLGGIVVAVVILAIVAVGWEVVVMVGALLAIYEVGINAIAETPAEPVAEATAGQSA